MNRYDEIDPNQIVAIVALSKSVPDACEQIRRRTGIEMTTKSLQKYLARRGFGSPSAVMMRAKTGREQVPDFPASPVFRAEPEPVRPAQDVDAYRRLYDLTKKGPVPFSELCDLLDLSPSKTTALIEEARAAGVSVHTEHGQVGIKRDVGDDRIRQVGIAPVVGQRQTVGVISDLHLGSKYCLRAQLADFVRHCYERGAREILCPGDVLDGMYRHGIWEVSHSGLAAQARDLLEVLPRLPGLSYRCITGNHDETFEEAGGFGVGPYLERLFRENGRTDLHFYGRRSAFLRVGGAVFHLWHPRGSASYAKSYKLQKVIEKYSSGEKPHVLLVGHFHQFCHVYERGVHGFLCPTFQGGGSAFGNSLGGAPTMGGMVLSWDLTEHGTMRNLAHEYRAYFEVERPHNLDDDTAGRAEFAA